MIRSRVAAARFSNDTLVSYKRYWQVDFGREIVQVTDLVSSIFMTIN